MVPTPSLLTLKWAGLPREARIFVNNTDLTKHKAISHKTSGRAELARLPRSYAQHAKSMKSTASINITGVRSSPNPRKQRSKRGQAPATTGPQDHRGGAPYYLFQFQAQCRVSLPFALRKRRVLQPFPEPGLIAKRLSRSDLHV